MGRGGKILASAGDGVHLWNSTTGKPLRTFKGSFQVFAVACRVNRLVTDGGSWEERFTFRIWDTTTGRELHQVHGHNEAVWAVALSADGRVAASGSVDGTLVLWDTASGKQLRRLTQQGGMVYQLTFSDDSKILVSVAREEDVRIWEVATGKELRRLASRQGSVALSLDGKTLAVSGNDRPVRLVALDTGEQVRVFRGQPVSGPLAFSPDGRTLASAGHRENIVGLWDASKGEQVRTLDVPAHVYSIAFSPDGKTLASGVSWGGRDTKIHLWEVATGRERLPYPEHRGPVTALHFAPDGRTLTTGSIDRTVRLWQADTGKELRSVPVSGSVLCLSPDGRMAAAKPDRPEGAITFVTDILCLVAVNTGKEIRQLRRPREWVSCAAFSPDGRTVAVGCYDKAIYLWEVATGKEVCRFPGATTALGFSPDGKVLACANRDGTVRLWEVGTGKQLRQFGRPLDPNLPRHLLLAGAGVWCLAFSPDCRTLAAAEATGSPIHLWDAVSGKEVRTLGRQEEKSKATTAVAFTPDSKGLVSASRDGTIRQWELAMGKERQRFVGHEGGISSLAVAPDGKTFATGNLDGTTLIWDVSRPD